MGLRAPELLIILAVVLILFGGSRVPQLGASLGQAIRNFKRGFNGDEDGSQRPEDKSLSSDGAVDATKSAARKEEVRRD